MVKGGKKYKRPKRDRRSRVGETQAEATAVQESVLRATSSAKIVSAKTDNKPAQPRPKLIDTECTEDHMAGAIMYTRGKVARHPCLTCQDPSKSIFAKCVVMEIGNEITCATCRWRSEASLCDYYRESKLSGQESNPSDQGNKLHDLEQSVVREPGL